MDGLENSLIFHSSCLILSFLIAYILGQTIYVILRPYPAPDVTAKLWQQVQPLRSEPTKVQSVSNSKTAVTGYYPGWEARTVGIMRDMVL